MSLGQGALRRLVAALVAVVVTLVLVEVVLRIVVPPSASQVLRGLHRAVPEKPWLYELVPDEQRRDPATGVEYAVNQAGFRDRERDPVKPGGTFRIAVVGDSLTFGYGVALDATFASLLEQRLAGPHDGRTFEVLNLGVSGYNPYTESALLRGVGLAYAPDLVLVQFCINDLNDPTLHFDASTMLALGAIPDEAFPDPAAHASRPPAASGGFARRACSASRLCSRIADALAPASTRDDLVAALAPHESPSDAEIAWLERLYRRMADDARARGGRLAVVVFPWSTQVAAGSDAPAPLQSALAALGARAGILVIDLLPAFRKAAAESAEPLFLDLWHPTARGHAVAADAIFAALACADALPGVTADCRRRPGGKVSPSGS